jgi:hypothetical protein
VTESAQFGVQGGRLQQQPRGFYAAAVRALEAAGAAKEVGWAAKFAAAPDGCAAGCQVGATHAAWRQCCGRKLPSWNTPPPAEPRLTAALHAAARGANVSVPRACEECCAALPLSEVDGGSSKHVAVTLEGSWAVLMGEKVPLRLV